MDAFNVIAVILGLTGAVLGGLGLWKAREAAALAAACKPVAEQPKPAAAPTPLVASDVNAAETSPKQTLPRVAPPLERPKGAPADNAQTARIVVRSGSNPGEDLPTNQGHGSGLIGIFLVNQGPAVAHDLRLTATFPNGVVRSSGEHHALSAARELTLSAEVVPQDFGAATTMDVLYRVAYRDGNGAQELARKVRVDGGWKGPWKTFIAEDDAGAGDRLGDAPVLASGPEPARE